MAHITAFLGLFGLTQMHILNIMETMTIPGVALDILVPVAGLSSRFVVTYPLLLRYRKVIFPNTTKGVSLAQYDVIEVLVSSRII